MEINKEIIDKLTESIKGGHTKKEIKEIDNISIDQINDILEELNNPKSEFYNPKLYKELISKSKENVLHKRSLNAKRNKHHIDGLFPNKALAAANLILEKNVSLEHAALQLHILPTKLYYDLKTMRNEELVTNLQPALEQFQKEYRQRKDKKIRSYPTNVQKDIILTALTFRVTLKAMTILFNTTIDDILAIYFSFDEYWKALIYLCEETKNEEERNAQVAYTKAKIFWNERNKLAKQLNKAKSNQEEEKVREIKEQLKEVRTEIDDTIVLGTIGKPFKDLSVKEKDAIAKYRPKYYLGLVECGEQLHRDRENIKRCEEDLVARSPIYAEQILLLRSIFNEYKDIDILETSRGKYAKDNAFLEEAKQNLEERETLEYFNIPKSESERTEEEQQVVDDLMNFNRGGGSK